MVETEVTVCIVNYNSGTMLCDCITALNNSSIPVNILVIDNASVDSSIASLDARFSKQSNLQVFKNQANLGFAVANNRLFPYVNTPYILYLNPDCFLQEESIEILLDTLKKDKKAAVAGCLIKNPDGSEQAGCRGLKPSPRRVFSQVMGLYRYFPERFPGYLLNEEPLPQQVIEVELLSGSCMMIRKEAIDQVGLLDENYFLYCEDYDWFYRFQQHSWKLLFTPKTQVVHLKGASAKKIPLRVIWYKTKGLWLYHKKFYQKQGSWYSSFVIRSGIVMRFMVQSTMELIKKVVN